jgi:hypothetical protein
MGAERFERPSVVSGAGERSRRLSPEVKATPVPLIIGGWGEVLQRVAAYTRYCLLTGDYVTMGDAYREPQKRTQ